MWVFVFFFVVFTTTAGVFMAACITGIIWSESSDQSWGIKRIIATVAIGVGIGIIVTFGLASTVSYNEKVWNNGYCECGGEWSLKAVTKNKTTCESFFYYECEDCKQIIRTNEQMR